MSQVVSAEWADIAARHWQGGELDCAACPHASMRLEGGCEPGRICMQDAYARRIDRFFRTHPELANETWGIRTSRCARSRCGTRMCSACRP